MKRLPSAVSQTYYDFWASLLPQSNRHTGFSLRSPTRRSFVQFDRAGFCFGYHLEYDVPDATVAFTLRRSDGEQMYHELVRRRMQIDAAFGGTLRWLWPARNPSDPGQYPAITWTLTCSSLGDLDHSQWPEIQSQVINAMVRLERAVVPHLQKWLLDD